MYIELVTCALFAVSVVAYLKLFRFDKLSQTGVFETRRLKRLPGPVKLPILGSIPSIAYNIRGLLSRSAFELLDEVKEKWGSPISVALGHVNAVIIGDIKTARKLMMSEDWANRLDDNPLWYERSFSTHYGLLISNGESWKEMRKFIHKNLTRHGFGRTRALEMIHEIEILNFFGHLDKLRLKSGDEIEMQGIFNVSAFNILWRMVAGSRYSYNNNEILNLMKVLEEVARGIKPSQIGYFLIPWLRYVPGFSWYNGVFINNHKRMQNFFLNVIEERRKLGEFKVKQDTFVDVFLKEIETHKAENITPNYYTDEQLAMVLVDLFLTGFIPTASCLEFLVMFMVLHPEIQKKCHDEMDTVIGRSRFPSINDNEKMPYTQAVCLEVLRHVTFIPITTRAATKDTQIDDYYIPKGTIAALNIYGIHHDKNVWNKPEEFIPERFLDENGRLCKNQADTILAFGSGKRVCPAEVFARVSTFTYFTYLMQKYSFECPPNGKVPDPVPNVGLGNYAKPFRCLVRERQIVSSSSIANSCDKYYDDNNDTLV